jgi:hypothetical protein
MLCLEQEQLVADCLNVRTKYNFVFYRRSGDLMNLKGKVLHQDILYLSWLTAFGYLLQAYVSNPFTSLCELYDLIVVEETYS